MCFESILKLTFLKYGSMVWISRNFVNSRYKMFSGNSNKIYQFSRCKRRGILEKKIEMIEKLWSTIKKITEKRVDANFWRILPGSHKPINYNTVNAMWKIYNCEVTSRHVQCPVGSAMRHLFLQFRQRLRWQYYVVLSLSVRWSIRVVLVLTQDLNGQWYSLESKHNMDSGTQFRHTICRPYI